MALIKSTNAERLVRDAVVLDLGDLRREGERIVREARTEAERVLSTARAEAQRLVEAASAEGHAEGLARGVEEGRAQGAEAARAETLERYEERLAALAGAWQVALDGWEADRAAFVETARGDVLRFALALAERVVHRLVETDPAIVRDQLAAALELVARPSALAVAIAPGDRAVAEAALPALVARLDGSPEVELREDESVSPGGCLVRTRGGTVDATIETQIARIAEALVPGAEQAP